VAAISHSAAKTRPSCGFIAPSSSTWRDDLPHRLDFVRQPCRRIGQATLEVRRHRDQPTTAVAAVAAALQNLQAGRYRGSGHFYIFALRLREDRHRGDVRCWRASDLNPTTPSAHQNRVAPGVVSGLVDGVGHAVVLSVGCLLNTSVVVRW